MIEIFYPCRWVKKLINQDLHSVVFSNWKGHADDCRIFKMDLLIILKSKTIH